MKLKSLLDEGIGMENYHIAPFCFEEAEPTNEGVERVVKAIKPEVNKVIVYEIIAYYFYHKGRKDGFEYIKHYCDEGKLEDVYDNRWAERRN